MDKFQLKSQFSENITKARSQLDTTHDINSLFVIVDMP